MLVRGILSDVSIRPRVFRSACLGLAVLVAAGCAGVARAGGEAAPAISVNGTGRVSVRPDMALLTLGVETRAATLSEATGEAARRMTAVLGRLKALGIAEADLTTVGYSIEPIPAPRRTEDEGTRIVAYRATNIVRVKLRALDRAGQVLDDAVGAGANVVRGVQFTLADPAPAETRARADAVRDATARARELAAAAGVPLGEVLSIDEDAVQRPMPVARAVMMGAAGPGPIEAGGLEIVVSVQVRYRVGAR